MRFLILLAFFLFPSIAQATIGTGTSSSGVLDSRTPEILLTSPQEGDLLGGGQVNFEWEIVEDSPVFSPDAVVLTVQASEIILFQEELPFSLDGQFTLTWNPTEQLPENTFWHVAAVDFFGNTSNATSGPFTTTDVPSTVPTNLSFGTSFPNPFNPRVVIRFSLPKEQDARLCIFDLAGREVAVPVVGRLTQGWHEITWNAKGMASGPYMARLESGGEIRTIKLTLLK